MNAVSLTILQFARNLGWKICIKIWWLCGKIKMLTSIFVVYYHDRYVFGHHWVWKIFEQP